MKNNYIRNKKSDLSVLLADTPETYYWIGFLIADGHFSNKNAVKLCLSLQDKNHLEKFAKFVKYTGIPCIHKNSIGFSVQDKAVVQQIKNKFNISNIKTYEPPINLPQTNDLFLAFVIGLVDGDGNISKTNGKREDSFIRIKCHLSWLDLFIAIHKRISIMSECDNSHMPHLIDGGKYAAIHWGHYKIVKYLKCNALRLQLPIISRKWDIINENYIGRTEQARINENIIIDMISKNNSQKQICNVTGLSSAGVSRIIKRLKINYIRPKNEKGN